MSLDPKVSLLALWLSVPFIPDVHELQALSLISHAAAEFVRPWLLRSLITIYTDQFSPKLTLTEHDFPRALLVGEGWRHAHHVRSIEVCVCEEAWDTTDFNTSGHLIAALIGSLPSLQHLTLRSNTKPKNGRAFDIGPVLHALTRSDNITSVDFNLGFLAKSGIEAIGGPCSASTLLKAGAGIESFSFRPARCDDVDIYIGFIDTAASSLRHLSIEPIGHSNPNSGSSDAYEESKTTTRIILERITCPRLTSFEITLTGPPDATKVGLDAFMARHPSIENFSCTGEFFLTSALPNLHSLRNLVIRNVAIKDEACFVAMLEALPHPSLLRRLELTSGKMTLSSESMHAAMKKFTGLDELCIFTHPYMYFYFSGQPSMVDSAAIESASNLLTALPSLRRVLLAGAFPLPIPLPSHLHASHKTGGLNSQTSLWARESHDALVSGAKDLAKRMTKLERLEWYPWPELCEIGVEVLVRRESGKVEIGGGLGRRGCLVPGSKGVKGMKIKEYDYRWATRV